MEALENVIVRYGLGSAANGDLWGGNGPIFQVSGKPEQLQLGAGHFELGIEKCSVLVIDLELGHLDVAGVDITRLKSGLCGFQIALRNLPLKLGDVARGLELAKRALELQGVFADLIAGEVGLLAGDDGVGVCLRGVRLLYRVEEGELDVHAGGEVVGVVVEEVLVVIVVAGQVSVLRGDVDEGKSRLVFSLSAGGGRLGLLVGQLDSRTVGDSSHRQVVFL